jgi:hypothetical protein
MKWSREFNGINEIHHSHLGYPQLNYMSFDYARIVSLSWADT